MPTHDSPPPVRADDPNAPPPARDRAVPRPSIAELFRAFAGVSLSSFGGVLAWSRRMLVEDKRWMTAAEFNDVLALCQFLPGPNIVNVCAVFGGRVRGRTRLPHRTARPLDRADDGRRHALPQLRVAAGAARRALGARRGGGRDDHRDGRPDGRAVATLSPRPRARRGARGVRGGRGSSPQPSSRAPG